MKRAEIARRHAGAELVQDLETTLATMEGEPVYRLYPIGLEMRGRQNAERFYRQWFPRLLPRIVGTSNVLEVVTETGLYTEKHLGYRSEGGKTNWYHCATLIVAGDSGVVAEHIHGEEEFHRLLFGELFDELVPIPLPATRADQ
jgi:hypothetical protein